MHNRSTFVSDVGWVLQSSEKSWNKSLINPSTSTAFSFCGRCSKRSTAKRQHKNLEIKRGDVPTKWCVSTSQTHKNSLLVPRNPSIDKIYGQKYLSLWEKVKREARTRSSPCLWFYSLSRADKHFCRRNSSTSKNVILVRKKNTAICIKLKFKFDVCVTVNHTWKWREVQSHNRTNNIERKQPLTSSYLLQCWTPYAVT